MISPDIEKSLGVATPPMLRDHPSSTLYDAAKVLIQTHARRLPLLDYDTETGHEVIVSVLTQYRLLKFISINVFDPFHSSLPFLTFFTSALKKFISSMFPSASSGSGHTSLNAFRQKHQTHARPIGRSLPQLSILLFLMSSI